MRRHLATAVVAAAAAAAAALQVQVGGQAHRLPSAAAAQTPLRRLPPMPQWALRRTTAAPTLRPLASHNLGGLRNKIIVDALKARTNKYAQPVNAYHRSATKVYWSGGACT